MLCVLGAMAKEVLEWMQECTIEHTKPRKKTKELELLQNIVDAREDIFNPFCVRCIMITVCCNVSYVLNKNSTNYLCITG